MHQHPPPALASGPSALVPLRVGAADLDADRVYRGATSVELTPNEAAVLRHLVAHAGEVCAREALLAEALGYASTAVTRTLDMTIRRLRAKVERPGRPPEHIVTARGVGYRFVPRPAGWLPEGPGRLAASTALCVGRAAALRALASCRPGVTTLVGPAGVGKTRLARHLAESMAGGFAADGGTWWVDLAEAHDEHSALARIAAALGVPPHPLPDRTDARLRGRLAGLGPAMVVLDDVEQVMAALAWRLEDWVAAAPDLRLVVTSREALGLVDEQVHLVEPLEPADAEALLVRLAPTRADDPGLSALARAVEHLPLALELAAARLDETDPATLAATIEATPDQVEAVGRLAASIRSSWTHLPPEARRALTVLSVFDGGGPRAMLDAAPTIGRRTMTTLIDRSLVTLDGERARLPLAVRVFARARLTERGAAAVEAAHRMHAELFATACDGWAAAVEGPEEARIRRAVAADAANCRAAIERWRASAPTLALRIVLGLRVYAVTHGGPRRFTETLGQLVEAAAPLEPGLEARAALARARCLVHLGRIADAEAAFDRARARAEQADDTTARMTALRGLVFVHIARQHPEAAVEPARAAIALARRLNDRLGEARLGIALGNALSRLGRLDEAEGILRRAHHTVRRLGSPTDVAGCLRYLTSPLKARGALHEALALHREGLAAAESVEDVVGAGVARLSIAYLLLRLERADDAIDEGRRSAALFARVDPSPLQGDAWTCVARAAAAKGDWDATEDALKRLSTINAVCRHPLLTAFHLHVQGQMAVARQGPAAAEPLLEAAERTMRDAGLERPLSDVLADRALVAAHLGRVDAARRRLDEAQRIATKHRYTRAAIVIGVRRATLQHGCGDDDTARAALLDVREAADREPTPRLRRVFDAVAATLDVPPIGSEAADTPWPEERLARRLLDWAAGHRRATR